MAPFKASLCPETCKGVGGRVSRYLCNTWNSENAVQIILTFFSYLEASMQSMNSRLEALSRIPVYDHYTSTSFLEEILALQLQERSLSTKTAHWHFKTAMAEAEYYLNDRTALLTLLEEVTTLHLDHFVRLKDLSLGDES